MGNINNSIPQRRIASSKMRTSQTGETSSNPIRRQIPPELRYNPVSKEYSDAVRSMAMAQINLGNKPIYCSVPTGYKN